MGHQRRGRKIDNLRWIGFGESNVGFAAGTGADTLLAATAMPDTVMRTRGILTAFLGSGIAAGVGIRVGVGFIFVPEGTGSTVLWSPLSDPNAPWFYYTAFALDYLEPVVDVIAYTEMASYREVIDSKAMRKAPPDTEVQVVYENVTTIGATEVSVFVDGRILVGN